MWTRRELKSSAKDFLRDNYWKAFVVCLIVSILTGFTMTGMGQNIYGDIEPPIEAYPMAGYSSSMANATSNFLMLGLSGIFGIISFLILIFFRNILEVGKSRFFLNGFKGNANIGDIFTIFSSRGYFNIVVTQLLKEVYIVLWSLLFIIPGIIKRYEYRMIPYILAERPDLERKEVFNLSRELTYGHKFDIFILDLSFIGWKIVAALFFGIGLLFLTPYIEATNAKLYEKLKEIGTDRNEHYSENFKVNY